MDPFAMAREILGDTVLDAGQLAQLQALNRKYFTELYAIDHSGKGAAEIESRREALEARIRADIRALVPSSC